MGENREKYIDQYRQMHSTKKYGTSSGKQQLKPVQNLINKKNPQSVLDYGCGQSDLYKLITGPETIDRYDPAIKGIDAIPKSHYDLVLCTDVMEHVPEDTVDEVLRELYSLGDSVFIVISCVEAFAILPNGENAHTTVKKPAWWVDKLKEYWPSNGNYNLNRTGYVSATLNK